MKGFSRDHERRKRKLDAVVVESRSAPIAPSHAVLARPILSPYGRYSLPRPSGKNEDAWEARMLSVQLSLLPGEPAPLQVQLYGVYDGHGTGFGDVVSAHIVQSLHKHFEQYLSGDLRSSSVDAAHAADARMQAALIHAFEQTDRDLMHNPMHSSASSESAGSSGLLCSSSAGSTATVAVVTDSAVYLAWAGDSRAIVLGTGVTLTCTPEHKADRQDEQDRIAAAGGRVFFNGGLRVMGMLATTRAIGDHDLRPYGVVPTPDVLKYERTGNEEYLVLASDGLWDVMSNEEVYEYAKKTWQKVQEKHASMPCSKGMCCACQAAGIAARALTHFARNKRHSRDDITVLVVNLHTPCSCPKPTSSHYTSNSSVLSRAPGEPQLQRTGSLLGSSSAGGALSASGTAAAAAALPTDIPHQQDITGAGRDDTHQQMQCLHLPHDAGDVQQQQQQQLEAGCGHQAVHLPGAVSSAEADGSSGCDQVGLLSVPLPVPTNAVFAGLVVQPSVCPATNMSKAAGHRRYGRESAFASIGAEWQTEPANAAAAAAAVSDLVMSSPFAGMLSSISERHTELGGSAVGLTPAVAAGTPAGSSAAPAVVAGSLAASSGSAPASSGREGHRVEGDGAVPCCQAGSASLAREVGSAPPGILLGFPDGLLPLSGSTMQQTLSLALEQCNARSCGGLLDQRKSLSCPLGSSELPVAV